jgi:hypothetical protein
VGEIENRLKSEGSREKAEGEIPSAFCCSHGDNKKTPGIFFIFVTIPVTDTWYK